MHARVTAWVGLAREARGWRRRYRSGDCGSVVQSLCIGRGKEIAAIASGVGAVEHCYVRCLCVEDAAEMRLIKRLTADATADVSPPISRQPTESSRKPILIFYGSVSIILSLKCSIALEYGLGISAQMCGAAADKPHQPRLMAHFGLVGTGQNVRQKYGLWMMGHVNFLSWGGPY